MLERYGHGGDLRTAEESFGLPASSFVDFSSNMNPLGPPSVVRDTLITYINKIMNYPDPGVRGLTNKLAEVHGVPSSSILIGNGAAELIDLAVRSIRPEGAAVAVPCFGEYGDAVRKLGASLYEGPLMETNGFRLDERWIEAALNRSGADMYMIGSPNNPTGEVVEPSFIGKLLDSGATVVVDEAFMDFVPEEPKLSLIRKASMNKKLYVLRSMTKFYSIPGIRLGYIVGHPESIAELRRLQVPWSVNSLAQQIGEAVLEDEAFARDSIAWLLQERPYLADELKKLGFQAFASQTNYLLLRLPDSLTLTAHELQREMGSRGILIRDASRFPGLNERYIRVAVKLREQNKQLIDALMECMANCEEERK